MRSSATRQWKLAAVAALCWACSEDTPGLLVADDALFGAGGETLVQGDVPKDAAKDSGKSDTPMDGGDGKGGDGAESDGSPKTEQNTAPDLGQPCEASSDCATNWCVNGPDGKVCSQPCFDACPAGWNCTQVDTGSSDISFLCVPAYQPLCTKCKEDSDCGGGSRLCLDMPGEGKACGSVCGQDKPCPETYVCKPTDAGISACVPKSGSCICTDALLGTKQACEVKNAFGICIGDRTCAGPGGWTPCDAKTPATEVCNGKDDDCDGQTDESLGGTSCVNTNEFGSCKGTDTCMGADGLKCSAATPAAETCGDNSDNDCNGQIDEVGGLGCVSYFEDKDKDGYGFGTITKCLCGIVADWGATQGGDCNDFNPFAAPGKPELCNNIDDDCNGTIDGENSLGCTTYFKDGDGDGYGDEKTAQCLCSPSGAYKTLVGGDCDDSTAAVSPKTPEMCNAIDDNCNGVIDEANAIWCVPFLKDDDSDGYGVTGLSQCLCTPTGPWKASTGGDCNDQDGSQSPGTEELCDGKDNNCNTLMDEDCDKDNDGYCNANKLVVGKPAACPLGGGDCIDHDPEVHPGLAEVCDLKDNDCNQQVDELVSAPCGGCSPVCLMSEGPKGDKGFATEPGTLNGAGVDTNGNVVLDSSTIQFNMLWISNSGEGSVSKLDTSTGKEVARYFVCSDPSRTAVDSEGNAWVGCRGDGRVAKIALSPSDCVDRDKNGVITTSKDTNANGVIDAAEVLAEGNDECVLFTVQPDGSTVARALGIDSDNNAWVGFWNSKRLRKLRKTDGVDLKSIDIPAQPYGLAIAQDGTIWVAGRGGSLLVHVNPNTNAVKSYQPNIGCFEPYGIAIDENGRIWTANCCCSHVAYRFDPVAQTWAAAAVTARPRGIAADGHGFVYVANDQSHKVAKVNVNTMAVEGYATLNSDGTDRFPVGMAVDFDGMVWAVNYTSSTAQRIDPKTMAVVSEGKTGSHPYTYSDMTGYAQKTIVAPKGTYRRIYEGWQTGKTQWMQVGLSITTPDGTYAELRVRSGETLGLLAAAEWTPMFGPFPPENPTVNLSQFGVVLGRYMEVEVTLHSNSKVTPILKQVNIVAAEYSK